MNGGRKIPIRATMVGRRWAIDVRLRLVEGQPRVEVGRLAVERGVRPGRALAAVLA